QRRRIWWSPQNQPGAHGTPSATPADSPEGTVPSPSTAPAGPPASPAVSVTVSLRALGDGVPEHHVGDRRILPGAAPPPPATAHPAPPAVARTGPPPRRRRLAPQPPAGRPPTPPRPAPPQLVHAALPEPAGAVRFTGLTWLRPLGLDDTDEVRVVTEGRAGHPPAPPVPFTITGPDGVTYVSGGAEPLPDPAPFAVTAPTPEEVGPAVAPAVVYARLAAGGVRHGTGLQVLQALWAGPGECLADLAAAPAPGQWLDPAELDGAFQALAVLDGTTGYLPTSLAELTCLRPLPARCRVHARDVTPPGTAGSRTVDLDVFDGRDHVLAVRGLHLTAVRRDAATQPATPRTGTA